MSEPTTDLSRERVADALGSLWWLPLLRGIMLIILGGYALVHPLMTAVVLAQVIGFFVIADGVIAIVAGLFGEVPSRGWTIVRGLLEILVGIFVFAHPVFSAALTGKVVLTVVAIGAIISGVMEIIAAIRDRKEIQGEGWLMLGGVLAILFGLLILAAPFLGLSQLIVRVLGAYAIFFGIAMIVFAFRMRGLGKQIGNAPQ
jgi:uncharacterized membrane protein HdeD (DUF308 family)